MSQQHSKTIVVNEPNGLHLRPAGTIAELASRFRSDIEIEKDGQPVDGKSVLSIVTLAAEEGTSLVVRATGADAQEAVEQLAELFERGFAAAEVAKGERESQ